MYINDFISLTILQSYNNNIIYNFGDFHTLLEKNKLCNKCQIIDDNNKHICYDSLKIIELVKKKSLKENKAFDLFIELPYKNKYKNKYNINLMKKKNKTFEKSKFNKLINSKNIPDFTKNQLYKIKQDKNKDLLNKIISKYTSELYNSKTKKKNNKKNIRFHYSDIRDEYIISKFFPWTGRKYNVNTLDKYYYKLLDTTQKFYKFLTIIITSNNLKEDLMNFEPRIFEYININISNNYTHKIAKQIQKLPKKYQKILLNYCKNEYKEYFYEKNKIIWTDEDIKAGAKISGILCMDIYNLSRILYYSITNKNSNIIIISGNLHKENYNNFFSNYLNYDIHYNSKNNIHKDKKCIKISKKIEDLYFTST